MAPSPLSQEQAKELLTQVAASFDHKPFKPHRMFRSGHSQTIASYFWPRRSKYEARDEERIFEVASDVKLLARCRWQKDRKAKPTVVLWHGMEGSTDSVYMLAIAHKAFHFGFNVIRMNLRNCGGTEHLTPTLYHAGLSSDLRAVATELIEHDGLDRLFMV